MSYDKTIGVDNFIFIATLTTDDYIHPFDALSSTDKQELLDALFDKNHPGRQNKVVVDGWMTSNSPFLVAHRPDGIAFEAVAPKERYPMPFADWYIKAYIKRTLTTDQQITIRILTS